MLKQLRTSLICLGLAVGFNDVSHAQDRFALVILPLPKTLPGGKEPSMRVPKPSAAFHHAGMGLSIFRVSRGKNTVRAIADRTTGIVCEERRHGKGTTGGARCIDVSLSNSWKATLTPAGHDRIKVHTAEPFISDRLPVLMERSSIVKPASRMRLDAYRAWNIPDRQVCLRTVEVKVAQRKNRETSSQFWGCVPFASGNPHYLKLIDKINLIRI